MSLVGEGGGVGRRYMDREGIGKGRLLGGN